MSDDIWRDRRDEDDYREFGSLFDDAEPTGNLPEVEADEPGVPEPPEPAAPVAGSDDPEPADEDVISFGESDTGSLPHWTEPPTGDIPRLEPTEVAAHDVDEADDGLDVWSSFSSDAPVWKDDIEEGAGVDEPIEDQVTEPHRPVASPPTPPAPTPSASDPAPVESSGSVRRVTGESAVTERKPSRITIGTDPSGMPRRPEMDPRGRPGRKRPPGPGRGPGPRATPPGGPGGVGGRDMPIAIAVGLVIAAAFVGVFIVGALATAVLITIVLGLAAVEFYDKVTEKGYRPAVVPGIVACVAGPVAAYWLGADTLPMTMAFAFMAIAGSFIGARSVEAGPLPNVSITTLAVVWIGVLGSFAMLILRLSTRAVSDIPDLQALAENRGTDTLFLLAVGVVANDVGALFIGSAVGKTPLRGWISPNKTVEGLTGGALFTILALQFVGLTDRTTTWTSPWHLLALGAVIAVMAPMGDLVESMFKRNLDIKDFGAIIRGHGGVLDRFDGFLFVLPAVYYLTLVLEPWTNYTPT